MMKRIILPAGLVILVIYAMGMFLFSDLGVLSSYEKSVRINELNASLRNLKQIHLTKLVILKKIKKNPSLVRHYKPWRGYSDTDQEVTPPRHDKPFLLRHPVLILLLVAILALSLLYALQNRKQRQRSDTTRVTRNKTGTCIKPSWS